MTNKINGIDVSECDYFEKQHIEDMYESDDCNVCIDNFCVLCWKECEKHNGCYFKQLKRLQEENEGLKRKKDEYYLKTLDYEAKMSYLIQALEEIRDILNTCLEFKNCKNCRFYKECNKDLEGCILTKINEALNDRN